MQLIKENIRTRILEAAKQEFYSSGYAGASLRNFARKAEIVTGNSYTYFENEDKLFRAVMDKTLLDIENGLSVLDGNEKEVKSTLFEKNTLNIFFNKVLEFVKENREELKIIYFKSAGSELENYKNNLIDKYTNTLYDLLNNDENYNISRFFIHNLLSMYINVISEVLMHDIQDDILNKFNGEISSFIHHGTNSIIGREKKWRN